MYVCMYVCMYVVSSEKVNSQFSHIVRLFILTSLNFAVKLSLSVLGQH